MEEKVYIPQAESIVDLMERQLPPPRWMIDDPTNDKDLVEDLGRLSRGRRDQAIQLYQLVRQAGEASRLDSIEVLLTRHNAGFWNKHRLWQTICDLAEIGWARLVYPDYDPTEPHYTFRGTGNSKPWHLWNPWRDGQRCISARKLGEPDAFELDLNNTP